MITGGLFRGASGCLIALLVSCASSPQKVPQWALNLEAAYPSEQYLAAKGAGKDADAARLAASKSIAFYFSSRIQAQIHENTVREGDGPAQSVITLETFVESQVELIALRFTEAWYNRDDKVWEAAAFIDRDEAWRIYRSEAEKQAGTLLNLVKAADRDGDPFSAALGYRDAAAYAESPEFSGVREFSQSLHPKAAGHFFSEADRAVQELPEKQAAAARKAPVFIEASLDHEGMLYQAMVRALGGLGFAAEDTRDKAGAFCTLQVQEGLQTQDLVQEKLYAYHPSLSGTLRGKDNRALLSFKAEAGRQAALTPAVAKRRAYTALVAALESAFLQEAARTRKAPADR